MKKILLTGSTSFLGSKFIELYRNIYDIAGLARSDNVHPIDILDITALETIYAESQPDIIIHTAAIVDQDANKVRLPNIEGTKNIVQIAKIHNTPIIYMSSESVYGGKEQTGEYTETDPYEPRSVYGETKVESEKIIIDSGLPYLILRAHRFVGINKSYTKPKQFPDTLKVIIERKEVHLDNHRLFKPTLINHISDVFAYYVENDVDKQIIMNTGVNKATTYYNFIYDVARALKLDQQLIYPDGEEITWPENSTLSLEKLQHSDYPVLEYEQLLETLQHEYML